MDAGARERFNTSIMTLKPEMQKAAMQMFTDGVITDQALATVFYNNADAMQVLTNSVGYVNDANLKAGDVSRKMQEDQQRLGAGMLKTADAFAEGPGRVNNLTGAMADLEAVNRSVIDYAKKVTIPGEKSATQAAKDQKENTDDLSVATADAVKSMQDLRMQIQEKLTGAITNFAKFIPDIIKGIDDALRKAGIFLTKSDLEDTGTGVPQTNIEFGGGGGGAETGAGAAPGTDAEIAAARRSVAKQQATDPTVSATGLTIKPGFDSEKQMGGSSIMKMAQQVHDMLGGNYTYFSGFKDRGIDKSVAHGSGRAFDLVLNDLKQYPEVVAKLKSMGGFSKVLDESMAPADPKQAKDWGPHIHAEVAAAQGAVVPATTGGVNVKVAEGGASEVIAPLKNGRLPGMDEMIDRLDQMISVMKDHRDTSEKIFNATA
jgi:hypothetical protein